MSDGGREGRAPVASVEELERKKRERARVARYYDEKTARLLAKYGPGPRVHFHTGLLEGEPPEGASAEELRRALTMAQERMIAASFDAWGRSSFAGHVIDVGCGLGGTILALVEDTPAERVTGVTIAAAHVPLVRAFAEERGVLARVDVEVCDASEIGGAARFDAAVCIEASCYFDRPAWLSCMRRVLKARARVFVLDCFLGRENVGPDFDAYWQTRIGTLEEYERAAEEQGFVVERVEALNDTTRDFWVWSLAHTARVFAATDDEAERARLLRSMAAHERLRDAFSDGGIRYLRLVLAKRG